MSYNVDEIGIFLSSSISRDLFSYNLYHCYLLKESVATSEEYKNKIQDAIDSEKDLDVIESLIKESDYYDSLLKFALTATSHDEYQQ